MRPRAYSCAALTYGSLDIADFIFTFVLSPPLLAPSYRRRAPAGRFSRVFLRRAWPCVAFNAARECVSPFVRLGFDVSRISADSWELRRRRVSNRRRDRFHNRAAAAASDVGRRPAVRKKIPRAISASKFRAVPRGLSARRRLFD